MAKLSLKNHIIQKSGLTTKLRPRYISSHYKATIQNNLTALKKPIERARNEAVQKPRGVL